MSGTAQTFVVLSDLHANARALRRALEVARRGPMDQLVILGDLLTYGCDVAEVIDVVAEAQEREGAWLLRGNHDQLYFDLAGGVRDDFEKLPVWIQESAEHTLARLDVAALRGLAWRDEVSFEGLLFSHANPFGAGDWRYLNTSADCAAAAACLGERGLTGGVFGHTHRARAFVVGGEDATDRTPDGAVDVGEPRAGGLVVNPGSVGQPRDARRTSTFARVRWGDGRSVEFVPVDYDVAAHVESLRASTLSAATKARLASFFEGPASA